MSIDRLGEIFRIYLCTSSILTSGVFFYKLILIIKRIIL